MTGITLYIEGGGESTARRGRLRTGFAGLFRQFEKAVNSKNGSWNLVLCGGRAEAYGRFLEAIHNYPDRVNVLLVDSEGPVDAARAGDAPTPVARVAHLVKQDGWNFTGIAPEHVHLMVQCMEAWIVADVDALQRYYKQGFAPNLLPRRPNLEEEPKADLCRKLEKATENTQKRKYDKIDHARQLLGDVDPEKIKGKCPHFRALTDWLEAIIASL